MSRERDALYAAMAAWLVRPVRPLLAVDWSDLKADGSFKLLRAGLVIPGRTLTIWEEVHPEAVAGSPAVEAAFLQHLAQCLPTRCHPIILTDAGFRRLWFRAVQAQGWDYVGRLRGKFLVQPCTAAADDRTEWVVCGALHELVQTSRSCDLGSYRVSMRHPLVTRLVVHRAPREPWVLITSLAGVTVTHIAGYYARRMTIEQGFRDLKSDV